jgi:hypothetical protein
LTTIAANRRCMAADRKITDDDLSYGQKKIFRIGDAIIGMAGSVHKFSKFLAWWRGGKKDDVDIDEEDFAALVLQPDGLRVYTNCSEVDPIDLSYYAVGSGALGAMVAMKLGRQPASAVKVVCEVANNSGGPVDVMYLPKKRKVR